MAAGDHPGDQTGDGPEHRPGAVDQRVQRSEPAGLPDVDVLVSVDDAMRIADRPAPLTTLPIVVRKPRRSVKPLA